MAAPEMPPDVANALASGVPTKAREPVLKLRELAPQLVVLSDDAIRTSQQLVRRINFRAGWGWNDRPFSARDGRTDELINVGVRGRKDFEERRIRLQPDTFQSLGDPILSIARHRRAIERNREPCVGKHVMNFYAVVEMQVGPIQQTQLRVAESPLEEIQTNRQMTHVRNGIDHDS